MMLRPLKEKQDSSDCTVFVLLHICVSVIHCLWSNFGVCRTQLNTKIQFLKGIFPHFERQRQGEKKSDRYTDKFPSGGPLFK